jgi:hypothetical protein
MLVTSNLLFLKQMERSPGANRGFLFRGLKIEDSKYSTTPYFAIF